MPDERLPPEFLARLAELEASYLSTDDAIRQSGFGGGPERWRAERVPILEAVEANGDFLDVGCANGHLLESLVGWAADRGIRLVPYGVDIGARIVGLARRRLPQWADHFYVANAWHWTPPRRFRYVYTLYDCVPESRLGEFARRLLDRAVKPGGRLIVGAYVSRSPGGPPVDLRGILRAAGYCVIGSALGGQPPVASFVWMDR